MKAVNTVLINIASTLAIIIAYHNFFASSTNYPEDPTKNSTAQTPLNSQPIDEVLSLKIEVTNIKEEISSLSTQLTYLNSLVTQNPDVAHLPDADNSAPAAEREGFSHENSSHQMSEQEINKLNAKYAKKFQEANIQFNTESTDYEWATEVESHFYKVSQKHNKDGTLEFGGFYCRETLCKLEIFNADFLGNDWTDFFQELENGEEWSLEFFEMTGTPREGQHSDHEIIYRRKSS